MRVTRVLRALGLAGAALALLLAGGRALAQTSMGGVSGTVTDSQGGVVPGATVTLVNSETNIEVVRTSNHSGYFMFSSVRPGVYSITVELTGLKTARISGFTVGVNETVTRNLKLELGDVTEVIEVTAQSELLQTTSAGLGQVVEEKVIRELPIQGRNFTSLLLLTPGVNPVSTAQGPQGETAINSMEGNSGIPGGQIANASIQGQQNRSKVYYVDGIINTSIRAGTYVALPDLDSLQEFKVQSQSDKAEYGGVLGGVVNMTSKSGANDVRASAFGMFRNDKFSARNPFRDVRNGQAVDHPEYQQGQFGANLSGPIIKNKTFVFVSYDGWRYRDQANIRLSVPTDRVLNGDFSQTGRIIYNPFTTRTENGRLVRDPFPGNIIPANLISPTMQAFLKAYMVKPNGPGLVDNFIADREERNDSNAFQVRVDHHFSANDNVFVRWTERRINAFLPRGDLGFLEPDSINRNVGGGWVHTFSPSLLLEVRGGWATQPTEDAPIQHPLGLDPQRSLNLPELERFGGYQIGNGTNGFVGAPWVSTTGANIPALGVQGPRPRGNPNWNAAADLTWLRGNHNFKFGFQMLQIQRLQKNQFGQFDFAAEQTRNPQSTGNTGDPIASALLGLPSRIQGFVPDLGFIDFRTSTLSGYIQDQWQLKPNVTLNLGVRYDYVTRAVGNGDNTLQSGPDLRTGEWLIALPELPGVCTPGSPTIGCLPAPLAQIPFSQFIRATGSRNSILEPIKDNIGPRIGLAWQINPKTVLRTGYGLFWDSMVARSQYGQHQFETWGWPQFSGIDTAAINREGGPITRIENIRSLPFGAPRSDPWTSTQFFNAPDRKNAYSHQWHLEIQRQFTRNLMVGAAYVGSYNGRMEYAGRAQAPKVAAIDANGNRLLPAARDQLRPWPHITGTFTYSDDIGMSKYNAFQLKVQQRFSAGLSSMLSYTYSRSIDTSSGWFNAENGIGGGATIQNYFDMADARGISSYDIPHILTWATVWELPFGSGKPMLSKGGPAAWLLGNWQLNWAVLIRSGQPFNVTAGGDPANLGYNGYSRANQIGDPTVANPTVSQWFNTAAFAAPVNSFGNYERNSLRAPGFWNVDLTLQRNLPFGRGRSLQVRLDAFNVFNHINWGNPGVAIDQPVNFGRITTMSGRPRQLQGGLRLLF